MLHLKYMSNSTQIVRLIYPADTFNPKVVDEVYADEFRAAQLSEVVTNLLEDAGNKENGAV